ncbi:MAG TPA: HAMP domain-containing sensor histidine kinase [Candidatus Paceibacterota bacterium]|nr:HAMP domain-containing sensor histidine kinase [Candidatus Paceibacterota bacterium]
MSIENITNLLQLSMYIAVILFFAYCFYRKLQYDKKIDVLIKKIQELNDQLKELDEQKTNFVSIASHQLRGPLTVMIGYVSMILEGDYGDVSSDIREQLEKVEKSGNTMNFLINDYLNASKIDKDEVGLIVEDVNVQKLLNIIFDEFESVAKKSNLSLILKTDIDENLFIKADFSKTHEAISSIVDNAIKYTQKGKITIFASAKNDILNIKIQDEGIGIKNKDLKNIFDKFQRSKEAIELNVTGTGLGLFVSKYFIETQGGKIWAESDGIGTGSVFNIEFPIIK